MLKGKIIRFWNWLKSKLSRKKSKWVKKELIISYWTRKDAEAEIEIPEIRFRPVQPPFYVDKLLIERN